MKEATNIDSIKNWIGAFLFRNAAFIEWQNEIECWADESLYSIFAELWFTRRLIFNNCLSEVWDIMSNFQFANYYC